MTFVYRTAGAWGAGKGSNLEPVEADENIWQLLQRVVNLEDNPSEPNSIADISVDGGVMTITLTGGEEFVFTLPVALLVPRGNYASGVHYLPLNLINVPLQGTYLVIRDHVAPAVFDPDLITGGGPTYQQFSEPGAAGAPGADGPAGPTGPAGTFKIDAQGLFVNLHDYDALPEGSTFLSTDGDGDLIDVGVIYIMGPAGAGDWQGPYAWQGQGPAGPTGATGAAGADGADGADGLNFSPDATGLFAGRSAHNAAAAGFSYLSVDGDGTGVPPGSLAQIYIKNSGTSGDWSAGIPFQGPQGPEGPTGATGPAGPTGPQGTNFNVNATGTFIGRAAYDAQATGFAYLSTNGDGTGSSTTGQPSIYIKASATSGDWGPRIPFQGPKGNPGAAGPAGAPGAPGPTGAAGVGVATGGAAGQMLVKSSGADYATTWAWPIETLMIALSDETTAITTGVAKATMRMPYKGQLVGLPRANVNTVSSSGVPTVDINNNGATILSTKLTIDGGEKSSKTAATPAVVSTATFADDDEFTFDIDVAGTGAKGLKVTLYIQRVP